MMLLDCDEVPADYTGAYYLTRRCPMTHGEHDADCLARLFLDVRDELVRGGANDETCSRLENRQRLTAATFRRLLDDGVIEYVEPEPPAYPGAYMTDIPAQSAIGPLSVMVGPDVEPAPAEDVF